MPGMSRRWSRAPGGIGPQGAWCRAGLDRSWEREVTALLAVREDVYKWILHSKSCVMQLIHDFLQTLRLDYTSTIESAYIIE